MAHGLESRVPFLDHPVVEFAATMPADVKFTRRAPKTRLEVGIRPATAELEFAHAATRWAFRCRLNEWVQESGPVREFVIDMLSSQNARSRALVDNRRALEGLDSEPRFGRQTLGAALSRTLAECIS